MLCPCLVAVSFAAHGQPSAPSALFAAPGDASATLTWSDPSDSSITGYSVRHATDASAFAGGSPPGWISIPASSATTTSHTVSGLTNGIRHHFQLRATNSDGDGPAAQTTIQLPVSPTAVVTISDANLRSRLESALGKSAGATVTQLDMAKLRYFLASNASIGNLAGLEHAVNLTLLSLTDNSISDISIIGSLTSLDLLRLSGNAISDISSLGSLTSLEFLSLSHNAIADISALGSLTSLRSAFLHDNTISDVSTLGSLTSLQSLALSDNTIADVSALGSLTSLEFLSLAGNSIADISALGPLTSLQELLLSDNAIADVSALGSLTSLQELHLSGNAIADVSALDSLTSLNVLWIDNNDIANISGFDALRSLQRLYLFNNNIADISPLGTLASLTTLHLRNNAISDVSALASLADVWILDLAENLITDVAPLAHTMISGSGNAGYHGFTFERGWSAYTEAFLSLTANPLSAESVAAHIPALQAKGIEVVFDPFVARAPPAAPAGLTARQDGDGRAVLEWTRAYYDLPGYVRGYELRRGATAAALGAWAAIAGADGATTAHEISGLTGPSHVFELRAFNDFGSGPAARASVTFPVPQDAVTIADAGLANSIALALGKAAGDAFTRAEMATIAELDAADAGIADLAGIEWASGLERLWLAGNRVNDLAPLASLPALTALDLSRNGLAQISDLAGLTGLRTLLLSGNALRDLSPLRNLTGLRELALAENGLEDIGDLSALVSLAELRLSGNRIADARPLARLSSLRRLWLNDNALEDLTPLAGLRSLEWLQAAGNRIGEVPAEGWPALTRLRLSANRIRDLAPLLGLGGLGEGDVVGVRGNPLSALSIERHLSALRARGVAVLAGAPLLYFPSASDPSGRQGFARVLNRSDAAGEVFVEAVDAVGERSGPVRLAIGAGAAAHFNSDDLERGNAAKGLPEGIGAPSVTGGWRLWLLSTLDIEALAYIRTPDGFVTSVHDALPRDEAAGELQAAVFNPGGNRAQRSALRLLNPGGVAEEVSVWGVDDDGQGRLAVGLSVPAGGALTVDAADLERGGNGVGRGLGDGSGKWRLDIKAPWPLQAVGLLTSPSGHLTNLSTTPAPAANGTWEVPLFPAAANSAGRQGFVRVTNLSRRAGEVRVRAADDGGDRVGPLSLALGSRQTTHFNSNDWERGNAAKGLRVGVGSPSRGDWRLALTSNLDINVTAFVRHADGFLTSMHDVAPWNAAASTASVVFFNPGTNRNQRSLLRLINDGNAAAAVAISARDDAGEGGGEVRVGVPAGEALTLTSAELESGGAAFEGAFGDGHGKWRLTVSADAPITVMSLLQSPTGHLTNLSSARADD